MEKIIYDIKNQAIFVKLEYSDNYVVMSCKTNSFMIKKYAEYIVK